jgi:hypothetical protein
MQKSTRNSKKFAEMRAIETRGLCIYHVCIKHNARLRRMFVEPRTPGSRAKASCGIATCFPAPLGFSFQFITGFVCMLRGREVDPKQSFPRR